MSQLGCFEGYTNFNLLTIIDEAKIKAFRKELEGLETTSLYGMSLIESEGLSLRVLGMSADENRRVMERLIRAYRTSIGLTPLSLRKGAQSMAI